MALGITVVDGTSFVGAYAPDGSLNVVISTDTTAPRGLYHPSGALRIQEWAGTGPVPAYAPTGALNFYYDTDGVTIIVPALVADRGSVGGDPVPGPFSDDFTGADNQLLGDRTGWTFLFGESTAAKVLSNKLSVFNSATGGVWRAPEVGSSNMYVQFTVASANTDSSSFVALWLNDYDNYFGIRNSGTALEVLSRVAGNWSVFLISGQAGGCAIGDTVRLEAEADTGAYRVLVNGSLHYSGTDAATQAIATPFAGIVARSSDWNPFIDDFECGAL